MPKHRIVGFVTAVALWVGFTGAVRADDWTQYRGPTANGIALVKNAPTIWGAQKNIAWKTATPGRGRSSPIVVGDRLWVTFAVETNPRKFKQESDPVQGCDKVEIGLLCLERGTGKAIYRVDLFAAENPPAVHILNSYATPTPHFENGHLYVDAGTFGTACVEAATGKILWKKQLPLDHQLGPGSSPIVCKDVLILVREGRDQQYVAGLDIKSGATLWKVNRPPLEGTTPNARKSFGTPLVVEAAGKTQVILVGAHWAVSHDPGTGSEYWRIRHGRGFSIAPRPVFGNDTLYFCTGCSGMQLWAAKVDGSGDVTGSHVLWKAKGGIPTMSSPVLVGNDIFLISDQGQVSVFDAPTGKLIKIQRLGIAASAAPLYADGKLYFFSQDGKTIILKATRELEQIASNELPGALFASPALLEDGMFLRTDDTVYCIREK